MTWKNRRHNLETRGSKNETTFSLVLNTEYELSPGNTAFIRWNSVLSDAKTQAGVHRLISIGLDTSEYPDYNLDVSWKQQVSLKMYQENCIKINAHFFVRFPTENPRQRQIFVWEEARLGRIGRL